MHVSQSHSVHQLEGLEDAGGKGSRLAGEFGAEFEDDGGRRGKGVEGGSGGGPVDGAIAGEEVLVFEAVVIVGVDLHDANSAGGDGLGNTDREMGMTEVEAEADGIEVAEGENFN